MIPRRKSAILSLVLLALTPSMACWNAAGPDPCLQGPVPPTTYAERRAAILSACAQALDYQADAGTCNGGAILVLRESQLSSAEYQYDAATGNLIAEVHRSDGIDGGCGGITYWPAPYVPCAVTWDEVLCR
jgi:hypothetical protein